ncbi:TIGR04282 family arsenosugar biosynthesis glycosyltransferase [Burkholderiales bacterium]|nr:TIGR04282 family arsenosugar biosynthesis glycosyltransferase [Burkholderiales bacterium]
MNISIKRKKDKLIQVFTRTPTEGMVKTRLIPTLGAQKSAKLHQRMTAHAINISKLMSVDIEIYVTPNATHQFFSCFKADGKLKTQIGESLDDRMSDALESGLERYQKVLLIGCDCPIIDTAIMHEAFYQLEQFENIFIPVEDGGFSLIGTTKFSNTIFENVIWGSDVVMKQIRVNLKKYNYSWNELDTLWDVDDIHDYYRLSALMPQLTDDL